MEPLYLGLVTPMTIDTHRRKSYITSPPVLTALLVTRSSKKTRTRKARVQEHQQRGQGTTKLPTQSLGSYVHNCPCFDILL